MKVQKKESKQSGNPARSLILVTVCTCTAIAFAAGGRIADFNGKNKVYAASENREKTFSSDADETDVLPTGIAGVVSGMNDTASPKKSVTRIGTSCEQVMVGQRIKVIEDNMAEFDVSSSMESSINELDARTAALAESARMMSDEDYDTLLHIVEAEAGTEDVKGRILVANVIMNRIKNKEFPDTVTEVVWQNTNGVPQFSPTYDGRINEVTVTDETREAVEKYIYEASMKSNVDRLQDKEKTGVFTGSYAINPISGAKTPIWLSDYVLADYGTGAIMCVPAHDDRDFEFATKFNIPIIQVIAKDGKEIENMTEAYTEASGTMINSGEWNGMESAVLKKEAPHIIEERGIGKATVNYKLRDWVFSRQRYWGEPIPIVHCPDCGAVPVPEDQLPLTLPEVDSYEPTGTGESPLAGIESWVNTTCPVCGKPAKRETNTMPQWAGSSWYFLRYVDNHNSEALVSKEKADEMLPVDMYIGGVEHAVLHLLYSRFYTKFLYDIGAVDFDEPFKKLFNQGMITGKNGIKMSKSKGNVVSPDDLVRDYGCDSLRMYELFVGPPELDAEWDDRGIDGVYRFLNRVWNLVMDSKDADVKATKEMIKIRNKMVYDITTRLESFSLNTVISGFMEYNNKLIDIAKKEGGIDKETLSTFAVLLAPFAPHMAEELWQQLGREGTVFNAGWPTYDEDAMKDDEIEVAVQINGKTRAVVTVPADVSKEDAIKAGKEAVADKLTGTIVKEIYVPGRIINIVSK